jgi:hypothetical protein
MFFNFSIRNFWKDKNFFKSYFYFHKKLTKYKDFEMQCITDSWHIFSIEFKVGFREDHAGVRLALSLLGKEVYFQIIDTRHWDYKNNCWVVNFAEEMVKSNFDGF